MLASISPLFAPAFIAQLTSDGPAILLAPAASWLASCTLNQSRMTAVSGYIDHMRISASCASSTPPTTPPRRPPKGEL